MSEQLTQQTNELTDEQRAAWVRTQFQKANEYLATKGIIPDNVAVSESRYLPPLVAIWKLNTRDAKSFWVISGDLPTDHMPLSAAPNAREAMRSFALHWQLKAEQIAQAGFSDQTQVDFANLLVKRAEGLYDLFDNEQLWQGQ
ncbi:MAG: DUF4826 family protein [Alishewanella agri]|uniref:DUF4826 domain-containing protein n=1 Tax=Alishewanella agri BL06 TaxID=1195246 RepID=I8UB22_9ALTE|nr:DUF4826 family protein [Alishewanella agri]EIW90466.1 hypothetical protein AGRI_01310 [Alishewanella agri BL06]MDD4864265.1 DUF4826 family protein [Alishewanella agri]OZB41667.1 MAG: DUF4826 domain-containing protein [Alishewanella sp. 34-51-39]